MVVAKFWKSASRESVRCKEKAAAEAAALCDQSKYDLKVLYHIARSGAVESSQQATCYHLARMRYFRTEVPSLATGTMNWAAKAAVFVYL